MNSDELEQLRRVFLAEAQALDRALDLVRGLNASLARLTAYDPWPAEPDYIVTNVME